MADTAVRSRGLEMWRESERSTVAAALPDLEPDELDGDYLIILAVFYDHELDHLEYACAPDRARAAEAVADHVFSWARDGYENVAVVVDLAAGRQVPFRVVQEVVWTS